MFFGVFSNGVRIGPSEWREASDNSGVKTQVRERERERGREICHRRD